MQDERQSSLTLSELSRRFDAVIALTDRGEKLLTETGRDPTMRDDFARIGFVQVQNIVQAEALTALVDALLPILDPIAADVAMLHSEVSPDTLTHGHRFRRVDPHDVRLDEVRQELLQLFDRIGLTEFGLRLGSKLTPLIRYIVGPVRYQRLGFNVYVEGDYISAHNDHHMGDRVNVQFPVTLGAAGGIRVLCEGLFKVYYDRPGAMNVLGPRVWHDVPPLLQMSGVSPVRLTLSMRFGPDTSDMV
jgi:hypothetical protein